MERLFINLENEVLHGNVLDVGSENYGIVYELCKKKNKNISDVNYVSGREQREYIGKNSYDSCVSFFSLKDLRTDRDKKKFFWDMYSFMKDNAVLYLWDVDKSIFQTFRRSIRIVLPGAKIKDIEVNDFNVLSNNSCKKICNMMSQYFKIIDVKCSNDLYYIKAEKKEGNFNEKSTSYSNKFSIYTQQLGSEIFKGIRKGIRLAN